MFQLGTGTTVPISVDKELNGKMVQMELDTGAAVSLISECTKERLFPRAPLQKPVVALRTYTAEPIPVRGVLKVDVKYRNYTGTQTLYVVAGEGPSLLCCGWLRNVQLDWRSLGIARVAQAPDLEALLRKHEKFFQQGLGTIRDFQAKLRVTQGE